MKVLVTGSRNADARMLAVAAKLVELAKAQNWTLIVGDASGVDAKIIEHCDKLGVAVEVFGAYGQMRRTTATGVNRALDVDSYVERDHEMAKRADVCYAIWNGYSRGTRHTFEYAAKLRKTVHVWSAKAGRWLTQEELPATPAPSYWINKGDRVLWTPDKHTRWLFRQTGVMLRSSYTGIAIAVATGIRVNDKKAPRNVAIRLDTGKRICTTWKQVMKVTRIKQHNPK